MESFGSLMFTEAVRARQRRQGTEAGNARMAARAAPALAERERAFIEARDTFYLATVSASGYPYVQHRGGAPGLLRVLDEATVAFADHDGNGQMVSQGNLDGEPRVALLLMDYPRRARLKLLGRAEMLDAADAPDLARAVMPERGLMAPRAVRVRVDAFDWNCPRRIVPRFTEAEIEAMLAPRLGPMVDELERLRARVAELEAREET
jgi:predicted pyridoxine 5'-phosphate oxidase superfamily flavin-nucleotide-binding protein